MRGTRLPGVESAQHLLKMVLRVRGQCVPPGVNSDRSPPRYSVVELNVGRFRLVELHVPVAVRGDFLRQPLAQGDLREGGPIRGETPGRECSCTCCGFCWLIWFFLVVVVVGGGRILLWQTHSHIDTEHGER